MPSSRFTFAACLLLSLAIHAALLLTLSHYSARPTTAKRPDVPPAYRIVRPEVTPPPPPQPQFGEQAGVGDANNSSPGDAPQTSPLSRPEQAALTRDPTGNGPTAAAAQPQPQPSPQPLSRPVTAPPPAAVPTPPPSKFPAFRKSEKPVPPQPDSPATPPAEPTPPGPSQPEAKPPLPATPSTETPPTPQTPPSESASPAGRPMPQSDQDSDPFAKQTSIEFKAGRVQARQGRAVKFARPRTNLASMVEGTELSFPVRMRLKVALDPSGQVRQVVVTISSGSSSIDRAFLLATYESWFEPAKNTAGEAISDEIEFNVVLE